VQLEQPREIHAIRLLVFIEAARRNEPLDFSIRAEKNGKEVVVAQVVGGRVTRGSVVQNKDDPSTKFVTLKFRRPVTTASIRLVITRASFRKRGPEIIEMEILAAKQFGRAGTRKTSSTKRSRHPADAVAYGGHWYKRFVTKVTWDEAKQRCEKAGGYLVRLETVNEAKAVSAFVTRSGKFGGYLCLGGLRDSKGRWIWINGRQIGYSLFPKGGSGDGGKEDKLVISNKGVWHDIEGTSKYINGYVCEWDH
jgi:hypothetical protein